MIKERPSLILDFTTFFHYGVMTLFTLTGSKGIYVLVTHSSIFWHCHSITISLFQNINTCTIMLAKIYQSQKKKE